MYDYYDDYLDELLEEAYLEGYYDSMDDDYYESRAVTRTWLDAENEYSKRLPKWNDVKDLSQKDRRMYVDNARRNNQPYKDVMRKIYPQPIYTGDLRDTLKGGNNKDEYHKRLHSDFKKAMGVRTYKDREPGHYLRLQEEKRRKKGFM